MSKDGTVESQDEPDRRDDSELVRAVNSGDISAFAVLYRRYLVNARRASARWSANHAGRDDIVSESFGRLLATFQNGGGPRGEFLPYLLRVVHNVAIDRARQERYIHASEDRDLVEQPWPTPDPVITAWQNKILAEAFVSLSPRWQRILWQVEAEGLRPAAVAGTLGLSANAVAALAYRAREGLRQAYLRLHVRDTSDPSCAPIVKQLPAWARNGPSDRQRAHTITEANDELTSTGGRQTGAGALHQPTPQSEGQSTTARPPRSARSCPTVR